VAPSDPLQQKILRIIATNGPVKARVIRDLIGGRYERADINTHLYGSLSDWVEKNAGHQWLLRARNDRPALPWEEPAPKSTVQKSETANPSPRRPATAWGRRPEPQHQPPVHASAKPPNRSAGPRIETVVQPPRIQLNPEQLRLAQFPADGNVLIRGQAGAGKTTVLTERALWLGGGTRLLLTYNRPLRTHFERLVEQSRRKDITVYTFHEWARSVAKARRFEVTSWMLQKERRAILSKLLKRLPNGDRLKTLKVRFLGEELDWIFGRGIRLLEDYLVAPRVGRGCGVRLNEAERRAVWEMRGLYLAEVRKLKQWDVNDPGGLVSTVLESNGRRIPEALRYDHVLIDEVQDFDKSWLEALVGFQRETFSLAGDLAQRIYRRTFTWKEVGIAVPPARSRSLSAGMRTTRRIMHVAIFLSRNEDLVNEVDYHAPSLPTRDGPLVNRIRRRSYQDVTSVVARQLAELRRERPAESVAVLLSSNKSAQAVAYALREAGVDAEYARKDDVALSDGSRVITTTMQSVKGLEWDHVFVLGLADSQVPGRDLKRAVDDDEQRDILNMKQRLLFVAMTRARKSLTLGGAIPFCRFFDDVPDVMFHDL
jgi:superfamily I DNA/RNA helicase